MKRLSLEYQAAIFDMDGLLLETEIIALETFLEACQACGYPGKKEVYLKCIGTTTTKTEQILMEGHGADFPMEQINAIWSEQYLKRTVEQAVPVKLGAKELLTFFKKSQMKVGLATSTSHELAYKKLKNANLFHFFDAIRCGDQVSQGKPHPEIYLEVAKQLGATPDRCIVFEDSDIGVTAAYQAGMTVVQIPDIKEPSETVKSFNHLILPSLEKVRMLMQVGA